MAQENQLVSVQVTTASALVKTGDFRGAEASLQEIASSKGDNALIKALSLVPPADLGQILVNTATLPSSVCSGLVSPEVFVKALVEVPKTWGPGGEESARLQLQEIFSGIVMRPNEEGYLGYHAPKFFRAISKCQMAIELLAFYLSNKVCVEVESQTSSKRTIKALHPCITNREYEPNEGDWDHLAFLLTRKSSELLATLLVQWRDGVLYERFLPSIVLSKAGKSALGSHKKLSSSSDGSSFKVLIYSMFGKEEYYKL